MMKRHARILAPPGGSVTTRAPDFDAGISSATISLAYLVLALGVALFAGNPDGAGETPPPEEGSDLARAPIARSVLMGLIGLKSPRCGRWRRC